jgi:hypothetical protein
MCNVNNDSSQEISWPRWVAGGVGSVLVVSAVAFAILGLVQPDWLTSHIGMAGDPHSWALWTIAGGTCLIGGCLIAYAIFAGKAANNRDSDPTQESFGGKPLESKALVEQFVEIDIDDYPEEIDKSSIKKELMTHPVMKTRFKDELGVRNRGIACIILRVKCISDPATLKKEVSQRIEEDRHGLEQSIKIYNPNATQDEMNAKIESLINKSAKKFAPQPALLNVFPVGPNKWRQHHISFEGETRSELQPAFLERWDDSGFGPKLHNPAYVDDKYIQMQEEGLSRLKRLMRGEIVTDHRGHKWQLDNS